MGVPLSIGHPMTHYSRRSAQFEIKEAAPSEDTGSSYW